MVTSSAYLTPATCTAVTDLLSSGVCVSQQHHEKLKYLWTVYMETHEGQISCQPPGPHIFLFVDVCHWRKRNNEIETATEAAHDVMTHARTQPMLNNALNTFTTRRHRNNRNGHDVVHQPSNPHHYVELIGWHQLRGWSSYREIGLLTVGKQVGRQVYMDISCMYRKQLDTTVIPLGRNVTWSWRYHSQIRTRTHYIRTYTHFTVYSIVQLSRFHAMSIS